MRPFNILVCSDSWQFKWYVIWSFYTDWLLHPKKAAADRQHSRFIRSLAHATRMNAEATLKEIFTT